MDAMKTIPQKEKDFHWQRLLSVGVEEEPWDQVRMEECEVLGGLLAEGFSVNSEYSSCNWARSCPWWWEKSISVQRIKGLSSRGGAVPSGWNSQGWPWPPWPHLSAVQCGPWVAAGLRRARGLWGDQSRSFQSSRYYCDIYFYYFFK